MRSGLFRFLLLSLTLCAGFLAQPQQGLAQTGGGYGGGWGGGGGGGVGLSSATTKSVATALSKGGKACHSLPWIYRYDCYGDVYAKAANSLAGNPAYRDAYKALVKVEKTIRKEVSRNADPAAPKLRKGGRTLQPIKKSAVKTVNARTAAALDEAQTTLLRSSGNKSKHFAQIAEAINSNKVLIRSALMLVPGIAPLLRAIV